MAQIEANSFADPWSAESFVGLVGNDRVLFDVAERAGGVVGYSVVWTAADEAELANVAVAAELRGHGIGALLLDAVIREVRARGAVVIFLEVRESNDVARALYASRGFHLVGRRRRYYRRPVEDALVLRASLAAGARSSAR